MSKAEVRKLIATGKLDKAIEELLAIAEGTAEETTLLLLSGQINQLKSNERIGIITPTAAGIQRNKIAYAVFIDGRWKWTIPYLLAMVRPHHRAPQVIRYPRGQRKCLFLMLERIGNM